MTTASSRLLCFPILFSVAIYEEPWGKDTDVRPPSPPIEEQAPSVGVRIANAVIWFHQNIISPIDGPRSAYRPSSSQYMKQAMSRYGFFRGFVMGCDRLLRENDEEWVYRTIEENGKIYKYDPAFENKYDQ